MYVEHLEVVMERKRTTIADYRGYLNRHLAPFFGGRPMDKIDRARVEAYLLAKKHEGLSSKTVGNHLNFLHGLFAFAVKREWVTSNVVALVDRPRPPRFKDRRIKFLTREELEAVAARVPDDYLGAVERPLYSDAAMTGLRQGELIALRWCDVDWAASRVRVAESYIRGDFDIAEVPPRPLGADGRPPGRRARAALPAHALAGRRGPRLRAPGDRRTFSTRRSCASASTRRSSAPRSARLTFHELRHTFGTQMAAAGAPMRAIQEWMGHADASTTEIYAHYAPDPTHGAAFAQKAFGDRGGSSADADAAPRLDGR